MKQIITLSQKEEWISYVQRSVNCDFYHSWNYHALEYTGTPLLFVEDNGEDFIAFPFVKRSIPETDYYDLTSVYGYCGPISNRPFTDLSDELMVSFRDAFLVYLKEEQIISVFSRLHPFFNQNALLSKFGGVWENGQVVAIDLTVPLCVQESQYQDRVSRKIRQLKQRGFYVKEATTEEDIQTFTAIYTANMMRLDASDCYMFDQEYFKRLLRCEEYDARLLFVYDETNLPVCGATIVSKNQIMQAHLLGTRKEFLHDSPAKLLTHEITLLGRAQGVKYYNLGGGLGFKKDSLFEWKSHFSKVTFDYYSWRYIADQGTYDALLVQMDIDPESNVDFFPLYRSQLQRV
ncbi:GNAT family N-acetyltransferase [Pedobacter sp.]|jgi:hypothetical protein|uniref:GNAT family N-acetyltransferase n=1 Tax=Pedobacter sp. TaxID=1411316 RepID=UPI002BBF77AA|nr:GNAT family N-acetyltransferase [Pedobacter sp.]HWW39031.1 GNAT family N-acetyltransferase [Pedobacter sp.]